MNRSFSPRLLSGLIIGCTLLGVASCWAQDEVPVSDDGAGSSESPVVESSAGTASVAEAATPAEADLKDGQAVPQERFPRQFPGQGTPDFPGYVYESIQKIESSASGFVAIPDRWRMFYAGKWFDPYNQNVLKADVPVFGEPGHEWFFETSIISDSLVENRNLPVPVGFASTNEPNSNDTFGSGKQFMFVQNIITSFALIRGNTSFKPPEYEFRAVPIFNFNHVEVEEDGALRADSGSGNIRNDNFVGFQELFADVHLSNLSERYDFVSSRLGIQQFNSDFRGFLFNDNQPGVRFFGNYDNNKLQFNAAWFSRLDKDTNSGVNTMFRDRYEDVFVANVFQQDALFVGHTVQMSVVHREDQAGDQNFHYNENNILVRPAAIGDQRAKNIYSTYFGLAGDGHIGRVNTTTQFYYVTGSESHNAIANRRTSIQASMFAQELSYDIDWVRLRASFFYSSGDKDPYDGRAQGFDSIIDSPNFAGGDLSFWQRQSIPLIGGGITNLVNRNSLIPNFRPGKEEGQSNFVNPGIRLYNAGIDFEILPELRLINNVSFLQFDQVGPLEVVRQDGSFGRNIGYDLSTGILYRPFLNNNVQVRAGASCLLPSGATKNLFGDELLYSLFTNLILQY